MIKRLMVMYNERVMLNALAHGVYTRAEQAITRLERYEGRTRRVMHNLGAVRMGQGDFVAAEALFEEEIEAFGDNAGILRALVESAYLGGNRVHAAKRIAVALADPDCLDPIILKKRAAICADPDAHARAMEGKKEFAAALALVASGDKDGAISAFRRAAEADATDFTALNNLGALLMNHKHDYEGAAQAFKAALDLSDQALMRDNLAKAREMLRETAKKTA
jgi:Tfp pilus assembly protein PilF